MGEFDEETVGEPAGDEREVPAGQPAEPLDADQVELAVEQQDVTPEASPVEELSAEEPEEADGLIAAIQDQLSLEDLGVEECGEAPGVDESAEEPGTEDAADAAVSDDDLAAAVAAAGEQVGPEGSLDDIAPGTVHVVPPGEAEAEADVRYGAPWWPFLVYLGLWIAFAGVATWQFQQMPQGAVTYDTQQYTLFVFGGLVLAVAGVFLTLAVWLVARTSPKRHRAGLFSSSLIKGALVILIGVLVWWGTIMALDYLRLGRLI